MERLLEAVCTASRFGLGHSGRRPQLASRILRTQLRRVSGDFTNRNATTATAIWLDINAASTGRGLGRSMARSRRREPFPTEPDSGYAVCSPGRLHAELT